VTREVVVALRTAVGKRFLIGSKGPGWGGEHGEWEEVCVHPFDGFSATGKGRGVARCHRSSRRSGNGEWWKKLALAR
jgi:hypothetical protein